MQLYLESLSQYLLSIFQDLLVLISRSAQEAQKFSMCKTDLMYLVSVESNFDKVVTKLR